MSTAEGTLLDERPMVTPLLKGRCRHCRRVLGDEHDFEDLVRANWTWEYVYPEQRLGGLLCPNCTERKLLETFPKPETKEPSVLSVSAVMYLCLLSLGTGIVLGVAMGGGV